jgi:hypothetical protein
MATTSVLTPPLPISQRRSIRTAAVIVAAALLLALVAFGIDRVVQDRGVTSHPAAAITPAQQVAPSASIAQLNAFLATPAGQAALVHEFAPGSFGARPGPSSSSTSPATSPATPSVASTPSSSFDKCPAVVGSHAC